MLIMLVGSSTLIYLFERDVQPDAFGSIPESMWWAMATLTTVGYGDVTPMTVGGKVLGGIVMMTGIGLFVLWTGIISSSFTAELRRRDFVVSWNMVAQVPVFAQLEAHHIGEIARLLHPLVVPNRYMVVRRGEQSDAMFFIVEGEVEVDLHPEPILLEAGDEFGEVGLLKKGKRNATVISISEVRLMVLEADSFEQLMQKHPSLANEFNRVAEDRLHWHSVLPSHLRDDIDGEALFPNAYRPDVNDYDGD
jgi:voltage-gated potassium channel